MKTNRFNVAMLSLHSSPIGKVGTQDTGGMSVYVRELTRELGRRGHRIDIFTRQNCITPASVVCLEKNVRLIHVGTAASDGDSNLSLIHRIPECIAHIEKFRSREGLDYDLIHSHYWLSGLLGQHIQPRWSVPHITMFHTLGAVKNYAGKTESEPRVRIRTENELVESCHRIVVASERERRNLIRHYGAAAHKIGVVSCGVNLNRFHPVDKTAARRKLGLKQNETILLYVGRLAPLKGLNRLISAVKYLKHIRGLRLVIVGGDGPDAPSSIRLKEVVNASGIKDRVVFAGRVLQNDLPFYYSAADLLAIPSHYESFGMVGLESLACGTPVVATRVGAMDQILDEGKTGFIVDMAEPESLASRIAQAFSIIASNGHTSQTIRKSALPFNWSSIASGILDEYAGLIDFHRVDGIHREVSCCGCCAD